MNHLTAVYFLASRLAWTSFGTVFLLLVEPYADLRDRELVCSQTPSVCQWSRGFGDAKAPPRCSRAHTQSWNYPLMPLLRLGTLTAS